MGGLGIQAIMREIFDKWQGFEVQSRKLKITGVGSEKSSVMEAKILLGDEKKWM